MMIKEYIEERKAKNLQRKSEMETQTQNSHCNLLYFHREDLSEWQM